MPDTYTVVVRNEPVRVVQVGTAGPRGPQGEQGEPGADGSPTAEAVAALVEATTPTAAAGLDATDRVAVTVDTALGSVTLDVLLDALLRYAAATGVLMFDSTAGKLVVRQRGGTAGTDEVQISHDGSSGLVQTRDGWLLVSSAAQGGSVMVGWFGQVRVAGSLAMDDSKVHARFNLTLGTGDDTGVAKAATRVVEIGSGTAGEAGGTLRSIPLTPAQITADSHNYAPVVARHYRLSTDASRTLTGLSVGQVDGQECRVWNVGASDLILAHQSASSTATNRFLTHTGADVTLAANQSVGLVYDATTARWRTHP